MVKSNKINTSNPRGFVLVTGLIFLLAATIVGVTAFQNSQTSYQISNNLSYSELAFQASETGRVSISDLVDDYLYHRNWNDFSVPNELTILDKDGINGADPLTENNATGEKIYDQNTLVKDMTYNWTGVDGAKDVKADLYVLRTEAIISSGSGAQQLAGYEGLGKSAGSGGGVIYFEIRSLGRGLNNSNALTASDYRGKIQ